MTKLIFWYTVGLLFFVHSIFFIVKIGLPLFILYSNKSIFNLILTLLALILFIKASKLILNNRPVLCLIDLIQICFFSISLLLANKMEFLALLLLIIYVGSLAVIFLFVIMLFENTNDIKKNYDKTNIFSMLTVTLLIFKLAYIFIQTQNTLCFFINKHQRKFSCIELWNIDIYMIGVALYQNDVALFLLLTYVLLIALIAGVCLAKSEYTLNQA